MNILFDKYSNKYFVYHSASNVVPLSFEELEEFGEQIRQICQDVYSQALQFELDVDTGDCEGGGCKI